MDEQYPYRDMTEGEDCCRVGLGCVFQCRFAGTSEYFRLRGKGGVNYVGPLYPVSQSVHHEDAE